MSKIVFTDYLHQDDAYELAEELGFTDYEDPNTDAIANWAYEVKFELELDTETHQVKVLSIDDKKVLDA